MGFDYDIRSADPTQRKAEVRTPIGKALAETTLYPDGNRPSCQSCVYFSPSDRDEGRETGPTWGQCRRNPPQIAITEKGIRGYWPLVHLEYGWCGEHATGETV